MRRVLLCLLLVATVALTAGCFSFKKSARTEPTTPPEQEATEVHARASAPAPAPTAAPAGDPCVELRQRTSRLETGMNQKDGQLSTLADHVSTLQLRLDEAIQEVVRTKAKLSGTVSRAEAASEMAEAEIALMSFKSSRANATEVRQAERLLEMSAAEYEKKNFGGAHYLSSQAKSRVRTGMTRSEQPAAPAASLGTAAFKEPISLTVSRRSNLRKGPGTGFEVLATLSAGTSLKGVSNQGTWVRVQGPDGLDGWIHNDLVARAR